jgi:hypothetical protein
MRSCSLARAATGGAEFGRVMTDFIANCPGGYESATVHSDNSRGTSVR